MGRATRVCARDWPARRAARGRAGCPGASTRPKRMNAEVHPRGMGLALRKRSKAAAAGDTARAQPCPGRRPQMSGRHVTAAVKWTPLWLGIVLPLAVHADNVTDLMERGRWKEARAAVATMEPGKARTLYLQSRVNQAFDQPDQALASAERAVQLEPNNALYHTQVAEVCGEMAGRAGKLKAFSLARRARKEAEQAVALDPKQVGGREVLANFFWLAPGMMGGDKNKAESMAAEIARISPGQGALVQAEFAMRAKAESRAESLYLRALQSDETTYTAH